MRRRGVVRNVTYLKEQTEADPLVVFIDLSIDFLALGIAHTWIWDLFASFLLEQTLQRVCGVNPTVSVQHVFRNVFRVHAIDGVAWNGGREDQSVLNKLISAKIIPGDLNPPTYCRVVTINENAIKIITVIEQCRRKTGESMLTLLTFRRLFSPRKTSSMFSH